MPPCSNQTQPSLQTHTGAQLHTQSLVVMHIRAAVGVCCAVQPALGVTFQLKPRTLLQHAHQG